MALRKYQIVACLILAVLRGSFSDSTKGNVANNEYYIPGAYYCNRVYKSIASMLNESYNTVHNVVVLFRIRWNSDTSDVDTTGRNTNLDVDEIDKKEIKSSNDESPTVNPIVINSGQRSKTTISNTTPVSTVVDNREVAKIETATDLTRNRNSKSSEETANITVVEKLRAGENDRREKDIPTEQTFGKKSELTSEFQSDKTNHTTDEKSAANENNRLEEDIPSEKTAKSEISFESQTERTQE